MQYMINFNLTPYVLTSIVFCLLKREKTITKRCIYSDTYNAIFRISKLKGADIRNNFYTKETNTV